MSINNLVHNIKTYVAGIHQFMNVGTGSTSISIDQIVVQSNIPIMTIQNGNIGIGTTDTSLGKLVVAGNIVPSACNVYDLGTSNLRWRDLYLSGNTIDLGGTRISQDTSTGGIRILNRVGTDVDVKGANLYASTNIGIGTTLARHKLDVQGGDAIISGSIGIGTTVPRTALDIEGGNAIISGNVGIGTSAPYATLHVVGNILTTGTITASNISVIGDYVTLNTITSNTEQIVVTNAGTGPALKVTQTGIQPIAEFYDYESGLAMTIANNGNIGIGTTAPQYTLDVSGNINFTGSLTSNNIPYLGIGDSIPVGAILPYYSATISDPSYLICDGATYQRNDYIELANALGVNPAATTFTVPDLRDKFLKGKNDDAVGATGGSATQTLTEANMPAHSHSGTTATNGAHTHNLKTEYGTNNVNVVAPNGQYNTVSYVNSYINTVSVVSNGDHNHTFTTNTKGSGTAFDILPPYNVVIYVIKAKNNQYITPVRAGDYWTNVSNQLIYQSGNVGIGTNAPQSLLDVNGNAKVSGTTIMNGNVGIGTTVPDAPLHVRPNTSTAGVIIDQVGSGGILDVRDGGVSKVVVDANGNVGIGTTNPLQKLHIEGNIISTNGSIVKAQYYDGFTSQSINTTAVTTHASVTFNPIYTGERASQIICQVFYRWSTVGGGSDTFEIRLTDADNNELDYSRPFYDPSAGGGAREPARPMMGVQTTTSTNAIVFRLRFNRLVSDDSVTISNARFFVQQLV